MSIDPTWLPHIAGLVGGGTITIIWLVMKRGWARDMEREHLARVEWERSHPAE